MSFVKLFMAVCVLVPFLTACYVEHVADKPKPPTGELTLTKNDAVKNPNCKVNAATGCIEGIMPAAPELLVDGKKFFDADTLRDRFSELIVIDGKEDAEKRGETFQIKLLTEIDNKHFSDDFEVYVKGDYAKTGKSLASGTFSLNYLPEGTYEVRVQKSIKFELTKTSPVDAPETPTVDPATPTTDPVTPTTNPATAPADQEPKVVTKIFCAKLYSESAIEIGSKEKFTMVFDDYSLYISDNSCTEEDLRSSVSI